MRLGFLRALGLSFASPLAATVLVLTALTVPSRAWTWCQLGVSGLAVLAATGTLLVTKKKTTSLS